MITENLRARFSKNHKRHACSASKTKIKFLLQPSLNEGFCNCYHTKSSNACTRASSVHSITTINFMGFHTCASQFTSTRIINRLYSMRVRQTCNNHDGCRCSGRSCYCILKHCTFLCSYKKLFRYGANYYGNYRRGDIWCKCDIAVHAILLRVSQDYYL